MKSSIANFNYVLKPSRVLILSLSFLYLLAFISILFISIPIIIKVIIILLIIYFGFTTIKRTALLKNENSIVKLNCANKGKSKLELNDGSEIDVMVDSAQWLFDYFAVLVFKNSSEIYRVVIAKDTLSQEQMHSLRLYLRSFNTSR